LLWLHAEAAEGGVDMIRPLTERGERQAGVMAKWIREHQPRGLRIIASPALGAQQTAKALKLPFETHRKIGPQACVSDLLAAAGWPSGGSAVLVVGHQPALGRLAALLLSGQESEWTVKKSALWWLSNRVRRDETQTVLRAVIPCEFIG
jgi:phosphohistidine phosphatase